VILLTLVASFAAVSRQTLALSVLLSALSLRRSAGITGTSLAASSGRQVPSVRQTLVTASSGHSGQTATLTGASVTGRFRSGRIRAGRVTVARLTRLFRRLTIVTVGAMFTVITSGLKQAAQALAGVRITSARLIHVDVAVADARSTLSARYRRFAPMIVGTTIASFARIARLTTADRRLSASVQQTAVRMIHARLGRSGTRTGTTRHVDADFRLSVEAGSTPFAMLPVRIVGAVGATSGAWVAHLGVTIALTAHTVRIRPEARLTKVTLETVRVLATSALTGAHVAHVVPGSVRVTVTRFAAVRSEVVIAGRTSIASTSDHVRLAFTLTAQLLALTVHRSGSIAVARLCPVEHGERGARGQTRANLMRGRLSNGERARLGASHVIVLEQIAFGARDRVLEGGELFECRRQYERVDQKSLVGCRGAGQRGPWSCVA
jgi:hypothetical protein